MENILLYYSSIRLYYPILDQIASELNELETKSDDISVINLSDFEYSGLCKIKSDKKIPFNDTSLNQDSSSKYFADGIMKACMFIPKGTITVDGELDDLPEQAFLNVGTIEEAIAKGKALLEAAKG